jgi:hypothetical protein
VLAGTWRLRHGGLGAGGIYRQLLRVLLASAFLALMAWAAMRGLGQVLPPWGLARQLALALVPIALAGGVYLLAARLLGVAELGEVWKAIGRRRRGARPPAR